MKRGLVSAALIVRDEEAVLDACLSSLRGIVDEIVIVDTGSADGSVAIAERHQARVFHLPWDDDFSVARNLSLEKVSCEWVLYIDADERLVGVDRSRVEELLGQADEVGFRILLRPHSSMTPYLEYRLWRSDPRIRFEGSMHERVVPAVHRVAETDGRPISDCFVMLLDHIGYEGDQRRKHLRNLPMLTRFIDEHPDHLFARNHLASVLDGLDRPNEAEAEHRRTIEFIRAHDAIDPAGVLAYGGLIQRLMSGGREFRSLLAEARERYPDNCQLLWIEGRDLADGGRYKDALLRFDAIVEILSEGPMVGRPAYDRRLIPETHAARGLCLFRLARYEEAADAYRSAQASSPGDSGYSLKRQLALSRAARSAAK